MSNTKFTSGPWFSEGTAVMSKHNAYYVAETQIAGHSYTKQGTEAEANARLIAAAPEMYSVLVMLREVATLVPDTVWAEASDKYNAQFSPKDINEYRFTMDIARELLKRIETD